MEPSNAPSNSHNSGSEPQRVPPGHGRVQSGPPAMTSHYQQQQPSPPGYYQRPSLGDNLPSPSLQADRSHLGVAGLDRGSPTASPSWALNNPRTGQMPHSPRAQSTHSPVPRGNEGLYAQSNIPSVAGKKRRFESDVGYATSDSSAQLPQSSGSGPPAPFTALLPPRAEALRNTSPRSFSQPVHHPDPQHANPASWWQQQHPSQPQPVWDQGGAY
ncbi:hypothetical protein IMZ48_11225, partial [Candidatus Bathyarchaeota archaeon]|nr:hypothetical protein [Candidatus Bathyarchaeota archaeon]